MTQRVAVAYITRSKGVRGHVKAEPLTDDVRRYDALTSVVIQREGTPDRSLMLEHWRREDPGVVLKFSGIDTPEAARDLLVKGYVTVERDQVPALAGSHFYIFDLVGCAVEDEHGQPIGTVEEVLEMPSTDVYVVRGSHGEVLIPAVKDFVKDVAIDQRRIVVSGIEELIP
jgi:16S rRNA processing protein RimM